MVLRRFPINSLDVVFRGDIVCTLGVDQFELHNSSSLALAFVINESIFWKSKIKYYSPFQKG